MYGQIYKIVKGQIGFVKKDIKATILPKPHHVTNLWKEMKKLQQYIGEYYHIQSCLTVRAQFNKRLKETIRTWRSSVIF